MPRKDASVWNERYRAGTGGWDRKEHAPILEEIWRELHLNPCKLLDLGCGRGRNSFFFARKGFDVVGVDISDVAIASAKKQQGTHTCRFYSLDILEDSIPEAPFDMVFDLGCFHSFDSQEQRNQVANVVASVLKPDGYWLSQAGSTDGPPRDSGPPRLSAQEVVTSVEPYFEIQFLKKTVMDPHEDPIRLLWLGFYRKR